MCPTRIERPAEPIVLDLAAALSFEHGLGRAELLQFGPQLEAARKALLAGPEDGFRRPQQLLDEYKTDRHRSMLGQILAGAKRMRDSVDRAVILAPPPMIKAAKVLFAACCHPHHNDLSRGQRGGRPRIFFASAVAVNDALQGLVDILPHGRQLHLIDERWGIIASDSGDGCNLLSGLFGWLWELLQTTADAQTESQFAIAVGPANSPLMEFAAQIQSQRIELADCNSWNPVSHPGVLLAASVMGMDVVKLLRGAAMMTERFTIAPPGDNPPLDLAGLRHLWAQRRGIDGWIVDSIDAALQPLGRWVGDADRSAQHLLIQVLPQALRRDRLRVTMRPDAAAPSDKKRVARYLNELSAELMQAERNARIAAGQSTVVVQLPLVDESSIGQLVQMFSIATAVQNLLTFDP